MLWTGRRETYGALSGMRAINGGLLPLLLEPHGLPFPRVTLWLVHALPRMGAREEMCVGQVWHHPEEVVTGPEGADGRGGHPSSGWGLPISHD